MSAEHDTPRGDDKPRRGCVVASLDARFANYRGIGRRHKIGIENGRWVGECPDASWNECFHPRFGSGLVPKEGDALDLLRQFRSEGCASELLYVCTPPGSHSTGRLLGYDVSEPQVFNSVFDPVAWYLQAPILADRLNESGLAPDVPTAEEACAIAETESPEGWGPWVIWAIHSLGA